MAAGVILARAYIFLVVVWLFLVCIVSQIRSVLIVTSSGIRVRNIFRNWNLRWTDIDSFVPDEMPWRFQHRIVAVLRDEDGFEVPLVASERFGREIGPEVRDLCAQLQELVTAHRR